MKHLVKFDKGDEWGKGRWMYLGCTELSRFTTDHLRHLNNQFFDTFEETLHFCFIDNSLHILVSGNINKKTKEHMITWLEGWVISKHLISMYSEEE